MTSAILLALCLSSQQPTKLSKDDFDLFARPVVVKKIPYRREVRRPRPPAVRPEEERPPTARPGPEPDSTYWDLIPPRRQPNRRQPKVASEDRVIRRWYVGDPVIVLEGPSDSVLTSPIISPRTYIEEPPEGVVRYYEQPD